MRERGVILSYIPGRNGLIGKMIGVQSGINPNAIVGSIVSTVDERRKVGIAEDIFGPIDQPYFMIKLFDKDVDVGGLRNKEVFFSSSGRKKRKKKKRKE